MKAFDVVHAPCATMQTERVVRLHKRLHCLQTWESRDILNAPHDGVFHVFAIALVKREEEEEHAGIRKPSPHGRREGEMPSKHLRFDP